MTAITAADVTYSNRTLEAAAAVIRDRAIDAAGTSVDWKRGLVVIDVTFVAYYADGVAVGYHTDRRAAAAQAREVGGTWAREEVTQTPEEYLESEFCRIHDC